MEPDVTCAVCSVRRMHGAGYGGQSTCARVENPSDREVCFFFFFNARVTSWLPARVVGDSAGGSNSLPDGAVHVGRGTRQLHDVTGKVQQVRLCLPCKDARGASAVLDAHCKFKTI